MPVQSLSLPASPLSAVSYEVVLEQLGWLDDVARDALADFVPPPMKNAAGREVGEQRAVWRLVAP